MEIHATLPEKGRDLRLDLFRGVANWAIYLDHIPDNVVNWITTRNYGFSDAADLFVFISGYTASFVYARMMLERGFIVGATRLTKRVWQLYVAHIILFVIYIASISYLALRFGDSEIINEFNVAGLVDNATETLRQGLFLKFKPVNLDVLPLYITLVLAAPFMVWCLVRRPNLTLAGSVVLYVLSRLFDWNIASYPPGTTWYFNPFCWQLLFVFAAWCGHGEIAKYSKWVWSKTALTIAAAWLLFAFVIVMTWHSAFLESLIPKWMVKAIYPIDKTDLDMLRFTHFLALATVVTLFISPEWKPLKSKWLHPTILCGQHSLPIFCIGVLLSFSAHWILTQYTKGAWEQLAVSFAGVLIMVVIAWFLDRAAKVPDLFIRVTEGSQPAIEVGETIVEGAQVAAQ